MASPELEVAVAVATAAVDDLMRHSEEGGGRGEVVGRSRTIDIASRRAEEAAIRRYEAANWLRRTVGVVCAKDLAEEPSEEEFRLGLRNGIILCNALNKVQPGAVPKVVEIPSDSAVPSDGAALCAYQYFENVRNFLIGLQDLGLPTFEASDLEKGGKGVRVVDCVLALKSFSESKQVGKQNSFKYGGIVKPSVSGKYFIRKNSEPFVKMMMRSHSAEILRDGILLEQSFGLDLSLESFETITSDSIRTLVHTVLADKKPEEVPLLVESLLSKVIHEFERHIATQTDLVKCIRGPDDIKSFSRSDTPPELYPTSICVQVKMDEKENNSVSMKEEVSAVTPVTPIKYSAATQIQQNFDLQNKQIQKLKGTLSTVKSGMEHLKLQYSEGLARLGKHLRFVSHAASGYHKVLEENRKLYNQIQDLKGNIRVYCRVRPILPGQVSSSSGVAGIEERTITVIIPSKNGKDARKSFTVNKVFGPSATQAEVFSDMQPLIRSVLDGYNVCIFAYGQTGSGKTHTMSGPEVLTEEGLGVNYRALNDLFSIQAQRKDTVCYEIAVQMIEIYNEQVRDLLQNGGNKKLEIRNNSQKGFAVPDANIIPVTSTADVIELMKQGQKNRAVCSTAMNDRSSRSHSCLTVHVQGRDLTSGTTLRGCMHLVDLAGSERVEKSEVVGDRLKEAVHINKSLSALGDVIAALAQRSTHVPYRNSKLTQFLQDSLGGQAKTLMFIHIAPEPDAIAETVSTLKFAERVATVELGAAKSNKEGAEVKELKEQIACLRAALARKEGEVENIRSTQSSPDIYRMRMREVSLAFPNNRQPVEEVGNLEVRSNSSSMQKKPNFELSDILVDNDSSDRSDTCNGSQKEAGVGDWVDRTIVDSNQFGNSNSFLELESDATQVLNFYQRSSRELLRSRAESIATEDSDDFDASTCYSSDQDMVRPASAPKTIKRSPAKSARSPDIRGANPARKPSSLQKRSNGPSQTPIRNGKNPSLSVEGRRTPNGKISGAK